MTTNRKQHERLIALLRGRVDGPFVGLADYLLDNGVTVEVPEQPDSDPWPVPGSVAIATVRGVEGVKVGQVTVTSRAVVVTEADVERLLAVFCHGEQQHDEHTRYCVPIREWFAALLEGGA